MQLHLLGTGSPNPLPHRQGSATLISHDDEHLLVDAGRGVTTQLVRAGVAPQELSAIFITHHHYDHIGALADLLLTAWHGGSTHLPLYGPPGTAQIVQALFDDVYHRELAFSQALARATNTPLANIRDVVQVTEIDASQTYQVRDWNVRAAAVDHGQRLGLSYDAWPCLAFRFEKNGKAIVISGDSVACDALIALAQGADALVQCCFLADADLNTPARRLRPSKSSPPRARPAKSPPKQTSRP